MKLCVCTFFYTAQVDTVYQIFLYNSCSIRVCFCDNWKSSFFHRLIFNWRTFLRWVAAHLWRQWAKNQVSTNQNSRNRWCQIVWGTAYQKFVRTHALSVFTSCNSENKRTYSAQVSLHCVCSKKKKKLCIMNRVKLVWYYSLYRKCFSK